MTDDDLIAMAMADPVGAMTGIDRGDAKDSLSHFCAVIEIPGAPIEADEDREGYLPDFLARRPQALHHQVLIDRLEAIERGDIRRLMVFMPPGSAKSTYASVVFPAWFMGKGRRRNVIVATYASDLARKIGRRMRSVVKQRAYVDVFGTGLSSESSAADEWALENGNEFMGGGILSGITGNRADLIVIDDPIKGRAEADSEVIRKRTRDEYNDSILTRLKPGGRVVLIQTRWHEDDLAGGLLPEGWDGESGPLLCNDGMTWEVLCIPAQCDRRDDPLKRPIGEMLWQEWFTEEHWRQYRANARTWSALYQQRPKPDEGSYFQRAAFKRFEDHQLPRSLRYYGTSDYAVTEDGGDFTRLTIWGVDSQSPPNVYRVASWGGQTSSDVWIGEQCDLIARWRPSAFYGEAGVIQKAIEPMLREAMRRRRVACRLEWLPSINDKPTRARSAQAMSQEGRVWVRDDHDGDCFINECVAFPAGKHDDDVDNLSLLGRALDQLQTPRNPNRPDTADTGSVF